MKKNIIITSKAMLLLFYFLLFPAYAKAVPRYISLAPSTTEILFALGLDEEIIAVSSYCNYPPATKSKDRIGDFSQPNIEKIIYLKPDYIFCTGLEQATVIAELKHFNLNVYVADPKSIDALFNSIRDIGKITNRSYNAEILIEEILLKLEKISKKTKAIPEVAKKKVFIEVWHNPLTTAGRDSFIDELLSLAGGINIAYDTKRPYSIFSHEKVIERNPDVVIILYMDKVRPEKIIRKRSGWNNINAVKNNQIYNDINPDILLRPGPRVADGAKELQKRLYPEE